MKKKLFDYFVTTLTVASAGLLIAMLSQELIHFDNDGLGYLILDTSRVSYFWPNGDNRISEDIWWLGSGLIAAAVLMFVPLVLNILGKNATLFFWGNILVLGTVIGVQYWGVGYSLERIEDAIGSISDVEYSIAFYFPVCALGFSLLAALTYTFFRGSFIKKDAEDVIDI